MKVVTATDLKTKTGETLDAALSEPVAIERNGRQVAVLVPKSDYERLMRLENEYWLARVETAEAGGFVGTAATAKFLKDQLKKNAQA